MTSMRRNSSILIAFVLLLPSANAWADAPKIDSLTPNGVQRGETTELVVKGANLAGNPQVVAPFSAKVEPSPGKPADAGTWTLKLTVAPETPIGVYMIRVQTDDGVSNAQLFAVGQTPQVEEKEDNTTFEAAQTVPNLVTIEGKCPGNDVDYFRFTGRKGQRIVVDALCSRLGSSIDPEIRLTTAARKFVASADDTPGLITDAQLTTILPEDTDYVVELADSKYQGGDKPIYRLTIGALPVADEVYPLGGRAGETVGFEFRGGTLDDLKVGAQKLPSQFLDPFERLRINTLAAGISRSAEPVFDIETRHAIALSNFREEREPIDPDAPPLRTTAPVVINGRIDPADDEDRFVIAATPGQMVKITVQAARLGSALDARLTIFGTNNSRIAEADDANSPPAGPNLAQTISPDPSLNLTVPGNSGELTLAIRDLVHRGGNGFPYRIVVEPVTSKPTLTLANDEVNIPKGGCAVVPIVRAGDNNPYLLTAKDLPAGLSVRPGRLAEGQQQGFVTIMAAADARLPASKLRIVAEKIAPAPVQRPEPRPIEHDAEIKLIFAKQENMPTNLQVQQGVFAAPALPLPAVIQTEEAPIEVVHGYSTEVRVHVNRATGGDAAIILSPFPGPAPPGIAIGSATIVPKTSDANVSVSATADAKLGLSTIAVTAKGNLVGKERGIAVPGITLDVVRPAAISLEKEKLEIKAGQTVELKGKLARKAIFKEPVTIKLNGLPAGLKADPVTVGPDASEFTMKVIAEPGAKPATVKANAASAFQLNKKDYSGAPRAEIAVQVVP